MLPCPRLDWESNSEDDVNKQVAELLLHYEDTHSEGLPDDTRQLLKACAKALAPARVR